MGVKLAVSGPAGGPGPQVSPLQEQFIAKK